MNFLTLVTEVIQGCRVEALGVRVSGSGPLQAIWYEDGYIILSSSDPMYPPSRRAALVSPLPAEEGIRPKLG
jgi:hypothetical protein